MDEVCKSREVEFKVGEDVKAVFGEHYTKKCLIL
jgi:hypothetical protein